MRHVKSIFSGTPENLVSCKETRKHKLGLFGAGTTTRANASDTTVGSILNDGLWQEWKYQMAVLNNFKGEQT